jgi:hypothetical protein
MQKLPDKNNEITKHYTQKADSIPESRLTAGTKDA